MLLTKNPINYYSLKVTAFHGDSVKNESARTKKNTGGATCEHAIRTLTSSDYHYL